MNEIVNNVLRLICLLLWIVINAGSASAQEESSPLRGFEEHLQTVIQNASPSCVAVLVSHDQNSRATLVGSSPFDSVIGVDSIGSLPSRFGGGVIIKAEADDLYILTNAHLIEPAIARPLNPQTPIAQILIRTEWQETSVAEIYASDPRSDLAILKTKSTNLKAIKPIKIGQAETLQRGSMTFGLGNPGSLIRNGVNSATLAMIANTSSHPAWKVADAEEELTHALGLLLEIDARLPQHISGGAILNLQGEFIGLTTALATDGHFAIPMNVGIRRVVETLLAGHEVEYGFLGMSPGNSLPNELDGLRPSITQPTAARVNRMSNNSPAERAGLKVGDIILKVNSQEVLNKEALVREVSLLEPGTTAELSIWRPTTRELVDAQVKLGKSPVYDDSLIVATNPRFPTWRGIQVDYSTSRQRFLPNRFLTDYLPGVVVSVVEANSAAAMANVFVGKIITKVNETPVDSPADFHTAVANNSETVKLTLWDETVIEIPMETASSQ